MTKSMQNYPACKELNKSAAQWENLFPFVYSHAGML